jgi:hypothetical protein
MERKLRYNNTLSYSSQLRFQPDFGRIEASWIDEKTEDERLFSKNIASLLNNLKIIHLPNF